MIYFVCGVAGSGKDTVGSVFKENGFIVDAFANNPKELFCEKENISLQTLYIQGEEKEKYRKSFIEFCETEKKKNPYIWINKCMMKYTVDTNLVITDLRRKEEVEWIKKYLNESIYKILYIERFGIVEKDVLTLQTIALLFRENLISKVIDNNKDFLYLKEQVNSLI